MVGDALENLVSTFDGFGREVCRQKSADIHFQNLAGARRRVQETFGFDFADGLSPDEWQQAFRIFQKRHLLAHKLGVIDEEYVQKANDRGAIVGRRVQVARDEVKSSVAIIEKLGRRLFAGVLHSAPKPQCHETAPMRGGEMSLANQRQRRGWAHSKRRSRATRHVPFLDIEDRIWRPSPGRYGTDSAG